MTANAIRRAIKMSWGGLRRLAAGAQGAMIAKSLQVDQATGNDEIRPFHPAGIGAGHRGPGARGGRRIFYPVFVAIVWP